MSFYPQEDIRQLEMYRKKLTRFEKSVKAALNFELENNFVDPGQKKTIMDRIIRQAGSVRASSRSDSSQGSIGSTLRMEHDQLALNLRLIENLNHIIISSSFQHFDHFKITSHLLQSFSARNSNLSDMMRTQGRFDD